MRSVAVINTITKATRGGKGLLHLTGYSLSSRPEASQGKELKAGELEAETTEEYCLGACSFWLAQLAFLNGPDPTCLAMALPTVGRTRPP